MKVRKDFVSNSSSSSFMIIGEAFSHEDLLEACKTVDPDYGKSSTSDDYDDLDADDCDDYELLDNIVEKAEQKFGIKLEYYRGISEFYDQFCIGHTFEKMGDDETKKQFLKRTSDELSKVFGKAVNASPLMDAGYDG